MYILYASLFWYVFVSLCIIYLCVYLLFILFVVFIPFPRFLSLLHTNIYIKIECIICLSRKQGWHQQTLAHAMYCTIWSIQVDNMATAIPWNLCSVHIYSIVCMYTYWDCFEFERIVKAQREHWLSVHNLICHLAARFYPFSPICISECIKTWHCFHSAIIHSRVFRHIIQTQKNCEHHGLLPTTTFAQGPCPSIHFRIACLFLLFFGFIYTFV